MNKNIFKRFFFHVLNTGENMRATRRKLCHILLQAHLLGKNSPNPPFSGQPSVENGQRAELNHVSKTSSSCLRFVLSHFSQRSGSVLIPAYDHSPDSTMPEYDGPAELTEYTSPVCFPSSYNIFSRNVREQTVLLRFYHFNCRN